MGIEQSRRDDLESIGVCGETVMWCIGHVYYGGLSIGDCIDMC